jgi:hypothetical protein
MGSNCDFLHCSCGGHRQIGGVMILIVKPGEHYDSEQGRVFRVVIQEETRHPHMSTWNVPPADKLPWWLAQHILEDAREQLTGRR